MRAAGAYDTLIRECIAIRIPTYHRQGLATVTLFQGTAEPNSVPRLSARSFINAKKTGTKIST
jgi:hypothetical protein